jgi:hypothetical protein
MVVKMSVFFLFGGDVVHHHNDSVTTKLTVERFSLV